MCLSLCVWVKVIRIIPEFRILRLMFHRKSDLKCLIRRIITAFLIYYQSDQLNLQLSIFLQEYCFKIEISKVQNF